jgi:ATP-dependent DNA helicase Q1
MTLDDDDDDDEQEDLDDQYTATRDPNEQQDGTGDEDDKLAQVSALCGELREAPEADTHGFEQLDAELASLDEQIRKLRRLHAEIRSERDLLAATIASRAQVQAPLRTSKTGGQSASTSNAATIDYSKSSFPWTAEIAKTAKDIWGVKKWRPGQEGAINATMAGREVVAILPTGGGKSLIFQIPALLASGTSIVVTPLISLMADQVHGLRSRGIAAEMIHASTSQADIKEIMTRMLGSAATTKGKGKKKEAANVDPEVVKLVYVTPERIEKVRTRSRGQASFSCTDCD